MTQNSLKELLEYFYNKYNKPEYISPDPLNFVYLYPNDKEIAGFIASCFALGRVNSIVSIVDSILKKMPNLTEFIISHTFKDFYHLFKDFRYRFFTVKNIAFLLSGISRILSEYGTLENIFCTVNRSNIIDMQKIFIKKIRKACNNRTGLLLADPENGSACKRLNLFLRWMVRKDSIDPGVWSKIKPDMLLIPLDTHMLEISRILGFTEKKNASLKAVIQVTEKFKKITPEDPVRYDFSLTRLGIHPEMSLDELRKAVLLRKTA